MMLRVPISLLQHSGPAEEDRGFLHGRAGVLVLQGDATEAAFGVRGFE